jgi:endonuclease/exonuclease/phosphatase family metal-dependent hydrolase
MTFNISYTNPVSNFENIREMILSENPDVIQFQEISPKMLNEIKSLKSVFPYSTNLDKSLDLFDSVILSKYPLKNIKVINNFIVKTNVILDETELTIIGTHLPAPLTSRLFNLYYDLQFKFANAARTQTRPIANLDIAIKQMQNLKTLADNTNQNLIIMGDLNMTPTSKRFTNFLKDTNLYTYVSYKRPTFTWPAFVPSFLGIQIDHVLFSKNFRMIGKKTTNNFGSDHRPLIVDLSY